MMISETAPGTSFSRSAGGTGSPRDVAVHPFHRIGCRERQRAGEHLVKRDAQCIEIASGVDRPVHSSGLLGRHVGERAGDGFGRFGGLALARESRRDAETRESDVSGHPIHDDVAWLDVLVHKPALMNLAERRRDLDGETQECPQFHGRVELALQRLATGILEHQHGPAALTDQLERPQRPGTVEFVPQSKFMCETINNGGMRALRGGAEPPIPTGPSRRCPNAVIGRRPDPRPPIGLGGRRAPHSGTRKFGSTQASAINKGRQVRLTGTSPPSQTELRGGSLPYTRQSGDACYWHSRYLVTLSNSVAI